MELGAMKINLQNLTFLFKYFVIYFQELTEAIAISFKIFTYFCKQFDAWCNFS